MSGAVLVVMAAGLGSRYGGLKQVEPIGPNGEWIIDYSVFDAVRAGFEKVVFVVREEISADFRDRFDRALRGMCRVEYVVQSLNDLPAGFSAPRARVKPWGTGHAVWSCREVVDGPFGVINADDFYGPGAYEGLARFLATGDRGATDFALVGYTLSKTLTEHGPVTRGICRVGEDGLLIEIVERHRVAQRGGRVTSSEDGETWIALPPGTAVSMNMWGFGEGVVDVLAGRLAGFLRRHTDRELETIEFLLPGVIGELVAEGRACVRVLPTEEAWFGVTYREDVGVARDEIRRRIETSQYPARLWNR